MVVGGQFWQEKLSSKNAQTLIKALQHRLQSTSSQRLPQSNRPFILKQNCPSSRRPLTPKPSHWPLQHKYFPQPVISMRWIPLLCWICWIPPAWESNCGYELDSRVESIRIWGIQEGLLWLLEEILWVLKEVAGAVEKVLEVHSYCRCQWWDSRCHWECSWGH